LEHPRDIKRSFERLPWKKISMHGIFFYVWKNNSTHGKSRWRASVTKIDSTKGIIILKKMNV